MNGMAHNDHLRERLGHGRVVGGICANLDHASTPSARSSTCNPMARMVFGAFADQPNHLEIDPVLDDLLAVTSKANFASKRADPIDQNLWEKWVMLATLAGMTTLMRASVGEIMSTKGGTDLMAEFLEEAIAVATEAEYPPSEEYLKHVARLAVRPQLQLHRLDAARHGSRRPDRGRPHHRRHVPPRPRRRPGRASAARRLLQPAGLRGAPGEEAAGRLSSAIHLQ